MADKPKYYEYFAEGVPALVSPPLEPMGKRMKEYWGACVSFQIAPAHRTQMRYYIRRDETLKTGEHVVKRILNEKGLYEKSFSDFITELDKLKRVIHSIQQLNLSVLSDHELLRWEKQLNDAYTDCYVPSYCIEPAYFYLEHEVRDQLMRILKEKGKEKSYSQYFVEMTPIAGEPFHIVEEKSLLEILKRIQSDARVKSLFEKHSEKQVVHALNAIPSIWTALQKHVRTYYWINNSYAKTPYLDEAFFVSQLKEKLSVGVDAERQLMKLMQNDRQRVIVREKALNELTISKSLQALLDLVGKIAFYQDVRKTGMLMAVYESNRLVQEIAKRFGYAHSMLLFALPRELTERQLHQPRFKTVLEQRMKRYLLVYGFNDWTIYGGNEAVRKEKELLGERRQEWDATMTNVMGTCASVGYAVGRAKIVLSSDELKKVKTGDVMVARSTRPEMVPAMKRAAAIVTDEGGITSHAAIVSRELGVPCVIATKVATRVFKDGDLLEVKANHGVINKLEG